MANAIPVIRMRVGGDVGASAAGAAYGKAKELLTGSLPPSISLMQGQDTNFEFGVTSNGVLVPSNQLANFAKLTLTVHDPQALKSNPLVTIDVLNGSFSATATDILWQAGTDQTCIFALSQVNMGLPLNGASSYTYQFEVTATTNDPTPKRIPLLVLPVVVKDSGFMDGAALVVTPPGARMKNNKLQVQSVDNSLYYDVRIRLLSGVQTLTVEGAGEA